MKQNHTVNALWDAEAAVWAATSDDVPGLATEAETLEALINKLKVIVPELLELNGEQQTGMTVPLHVLAQRNVWV